jgi:hypothetical protein
VAALVWFVVGISLWHFTVWVPDRFWGGIVGAFLGAVTGGMATGLIEQLASGKGFGDTGMVTVLAAVPGTLIGLAAIYAVGIRADLAAGIERR